MLGVEPPVTQAAGHLGRTGVRMPSQVPPQMRPLPPLPATCPPFPPTTRDSTTLPRGFCPQCLPQLRCNLLPGEAGSPLGLDTSVSWAFNRLTGKGQRRFQDVQAGGVAEPTSQAPGQGLCFCAQRPHPQVPYPLPLIKNQLHTLRAPGSTGLTWAVGIPS